MVLILPEPEVSGRARDLSDVLDPQDEVLPPGTSSTSQPSTGFREEVLAARPMAPDPALLSATDEERGTRAEQALEALLSHGDPGSERNYKDEAELLQSVSDVMLQPELCTANATQQFGLAAWRYVLIGHYQRRQRQVPRQNTRLLSMLCKGYRWTWQPCSAADPKKLVGRMSRTAALGAMTLKRPGFLGELVNSAKARHGSLEPDRQRWYIDHGGSVRHRSSEGVTVEVATATSVCSQWI